MADILYTTADAIRSTIGIDENDVSDAMLLAQNLDLQMIERLEVFLPTYEAVYDGSDAGERRLTLWCQYFGALQLIENSALGIPQKIQANNDQLARFQVDFDKLVEKLRNKLVALETKMIESVTGLPVIQFSLMGKSTPDFNPVTG
jgi:hypothetical protein